MKIMKKKKEPCIDDFFLNESLCKIEKTEHFLECPYVFSSTVCRADHFRMPLYDYWCNKIRETPRLHRKQWEFVFIAQALNERGFLREGCCGVGFGVGREPLVDLFASFGCHVTATDLSTDEAEMSGWIKSNEHSDSKSSLYRGISDASEFDSRVIFRTVNMNHIPEDLGKFDFCYSSCSVEHVGSLQKSFDFLVNSIGLLRPGGISIHTTELNLSSNTLTVETGPTVLWRRQDLLRLRDVMSQQGHIVAPFDFFLGDGEVNHYIDLPPFKDAPHLRLQLEEFTSTSVGVIIQKKS